MAAASTTKISWRLQEFEAHSRTVSCLALGKSSGRLLATGGEDCRVNIWSVSKANCIMSLTGHKNPVECVQFSTSEEQVAAGSQSGSIRIWDLEAAKSLRTLMGHNANITSLGFHPFGDFLASSSMDTSIKLWDVRRKGYVFRYKGHTQAVRSLAFSPDGKWLASASDDCTVKLWDLTQGKTITEFRSHTAAVNIVQFHPNEYLLASGSSDRSLKLWDLEKFTMISSLEGDTSAVRCLLFSPDGSCLFSGATDSLRVFGWEPDRCFDVVPVRWGRVSDLSICSQQLIGVSHQLSSVSSYVVDLKRVKKSGGAVIQGIIQDNQPLTEPKDPRGAALRRSYERPTTSCSSQRVKQRSEADRRSPEGERRSPSEDEADEKLSSAEIHNAEDYKEIFQPRNAISRTPPRMSEPFPAPPEDESVVVIGRQLKDLISPFPDKQQPPPLASSTPVQRVEPTVVSCGKRLPPISSNPPASSPPPPPSQVTPTKSRPQPRIILSTRNEPIGLNVADFLPSSANHRATVLTDDEALSQIKKGHDTMCVMLSSRHKNLQTVRAVWAREDIKSALDTAISMNDLSIVVDILNIINMQPTVWKLDLCTTILPQIDRLLQSKYESYMQTGSTSLKLIMKHFWMLISDTLKASPSVGVDISREERHQKCRACCKHLKNLSNIVKNKGVQVGRHGSAFKELQLLMAPLDDAL
ncbi:katanin p80 WD40 repeat-containing subunit B1 [Melanotaenia boesemani]|uniref:katanin p80 WD40 repeat-containing subunit B1 n=1 Tax=Melanotaenia boesemani TaxID=1250792 RepID=UPI001C05B3FE|nr:katanin p80 WD40 repeat-containing subunit B1 [Melanotaenia boesemani]XP_041849714.1 katanin p80 WD40 repeat-containing subunit B1 [Melanotaenia boesemani]XP_041849715.1 katanin p80 WD40 repeat-containing subunit B1 [Melanotaenia boesemani]XP_041849716.1 katanin p80 WD40 repeat-containing subunit B1 [Melanotaenia boesemani]XP_041849717.1 katanin p80 WD40 repeat-containing subunit B1 [Melanotaenia boesemani]XP_041849718.1 katanin p80 WD40 repeat-containing subunit B1 [Melanotaenia boesemani]